MAKGFVGVTTPRPKRQNTLDVSSALGNREHTSLSLPYHALRRTAESPELRRATIALSLVQYFLLFPITKRMICKLRLTKTKAWISLSSKNVLSLGGKISITFLFLVEIKLLSTEERHRCINLLLTYYVAYITEHDNQWQNAQMMNRLLPYQSSIWPLQVTVLSSAKLN